MLQCVFHVDKSIALYAIENCLNCKSHATQSSHDSVAIDYMCKTQNKVQTLYTSTCTCTRYIHTYMLLYQIHTYIDTCTRYISDLITLGTSEYQ